MNNKKMFSVVLLSLIICICFFADVLVVSEIIKDNPQESVTVTQNSSEIVTVSEGDAEITVPRDQVSEVKSKNGEAESDAETTVSDESALIAEEASDNRKMNFDILKDKKVIYLASFTMIFVFALAVLIAEVKEKGSGARKSDIKVTSIGKINNIGKRAYQQDSIGVDEYKDGVLGIVADGMGGLSGGDEISSAIVVNMLQNAQLSKNVPFDEFLLSLTNQAVNEVNRKLGASGYYKSGSTIVAVYVKDDRFHWVSIGDSRIYLYRNGALLQINREHTYENELLHNVLNNETTFGRAKSDSQKNKLTSFIGMGKLKYSDASVRGTQLVAGDRLILMSDGVFGTLSESEIAELIRINPGCEDAAKAIEEAVIKKAKRGQDNFTALVFGF